MSTAAASALLLPLFGVVGSAATVVLMALSAGWLTWKASGLLGKSASTDSFRAAFASLNVFVLMVMALIAADPYL
jgi:hypothetical protein